ncbi:hypothetical protein [Helicobacter mustelae]|uniref:hypothetical protein n=1 Tax=Helicobacter mustelae TaxID=217 RepID=UPI0013051EF9|nr:hypothetical protein [Helicobacter mustelae]
MWIAIILLLYFSYIKKTFKELQSSFLHAAGAASGGAAVACKYHSNNNGANNLVFTDGGLVNAAVNSMGQGVNTLVMNTSNIVSNPILLTGNAVTNQAEGAGVGGNNLYFQNNGTSSPGSGGAPDGTVQNNANAKIAVILSRAPCTTRVIAILFALPVWQKALAITRRE